MSITRLDILKRFVECFGYSSYLEVGLGKGSTFQRLPAAEKIGVDPRWRLWSALDLRVKKTASDRFFAKNRRRFDLIFIDGLHEAKQAYRDVRNALDVLEPGGTIIMHDCMPQDEGEQKVPRVQVVWTGDVWRAFLKASQDPGLDTLILDTDRGCGVIRRGTRPDSAPVPPEDIDPLDESSVSWRDFKAHRHEWLRIFPADEVYGVIDELADADAAKQAESAS